MTEADFGELARSIPTGTVLRAGVPPGEMAARCKRCDGRVRDADACPFCGLAQLHFPCETHPERDGTGRCVICRRAVCALCDAGVSHSSLCEDHAGVAVIQGWAQLYSTTREFEAHLLRENLLADEIEARVFSQKDMMFSVDVGELSIVRLLVPVNQFEEARQILRSHMDPSGEVRFACPACGEPYEQDSHECANCDPADLA